MSRSIEKFAKKKMMPRGFALRWPCDKVMVSGSGIKQQKSKVLICMADMRKIGWKVCTLCPTLKVLLHDTARQLDRMNMTDYIDPYNTHMDLNNQQLLLLQRSTAVQVRSSVRLMPQNRPSGRGLLPSPTAWSSDQHHLAMLVDVSRHTLGRTEGRGLGFGQLVRTHTGKCLKCQSSSDGHSDHNALCAGGS